MRRKMIRKWTDNMRGMEKGTGPALKSAEPMYRRLKPKELGTQLRLALSRPLWDPDRVTSKAGENKKKQTSKSREVDLFLLQGFLFHFAPKKACISVARVVRW